MSNRPFDDTCPIGKAASVVAHPCTLMILRELFQEGPCRFQDFDARGRGFSKNTVSARLKLLVDGGYVETTLYESHPPRYSYALSAKGRKLGPIMEAMFEWGKRT